MLIQLIMEFVYVAFQFFSELIDLPNFPVQVDTYVSMFFDYIKLGLSLLANYVDLNYLLTLLSLYITLVLVMETYKFFMWVLKKIPLLGIK